MFVTRLVAISTVLWMLQFQPQSTTVTEVPSVRFSDPSLTDSGNCANGQCRMPKVAAVVEPVAKAVAQPVTKTAQYFKQRQPVRSALRRLVRR